MEWHDNDLFWKNFEPALFDETRMALAPEEIEQILALAAIAPKARVLDMCCGAGRHCIELARRGCTVVGVDRTALYLERASAAAAKAGVQIELVEEDMRRFSRPGHFDLALSLCTSFGIFEDPADERAVLERLHENLRAGATLVMDLMGREVLARIFRPRHWREFEPGRYLLEERTVYENWSRVRVRWILLDAGGTREQIFTLRLYAGTELRELLADIGFQDIRILGDLAGAPYDHKAERLVVVARK